MPLKYRRRLLGHLQHEGYEPASVKTLAADLRVPEDEFADFEGAVRELKDRGELMLDPQGMVRLPRLGSEVTGVFKKNARGFGFIVPERASVGGDVFVPAHAVADALTGDVVRARIEPDRRGEGFVGEIVQIVKRKRARFTGELMQRGGKWIVQPDGKLLTEPISVQDASSKNAHAGDKVVVEITHFPEGGMLAEGVVVEVLGEAGRPDVETQAVIAAYNLPGEFPESCVDQARHESERFHEEVARAAKAGWPGSEREDLTGDFIITIDPPDAKDYDDAISIRRTGEGWALGVHIADVAHFIEPGSPLDVEAKERGNSVYLPRLVIPMLPEVLSNGICSLQEGVVRYCKSAFMHYDRHGRVTRSGVASTAIKSAKRLTYLEAQALIDGDDGLARTHAKTEPNYTPELRAALKEMDALARAIRQRRREAGMIHLELPDVVLLFDEHGRVVDAEREDDAFTHTIIEMLMVEANECLARLFEKLRVPLLRRVHPEPTPGDADPLRTVARVAGYAIPKSPTRQEMQQLLDATAGTPAAAAVHMAVLRTLTKAEYSPALIGHFALASEAYAHFTSPIRRYPDLTVHRALAEYLAHTENGKRPPISTHDQHALGRKLMESERCPSEDDLVEIGRHCTSTEENAESAERDLRQFLVLQLMAEHLGESFDGIVTGVTHAGVFIRIEKYLAEGLIKTADLPAGKDGRFGVWKLDPRTGALANQASGRSFSLGHRVKVTIANVDLSARRMDLVITDEASREVGKKIRLGGAGGPGGGLGGLSVGGKPDWNAIKFGKTGSERRSQRSKQRDKSKTEHRRKKD
ncbi:MAG: VacB/RNase II family 3'-5' exoribonuclease [Phycisphaerae bacterium]|nr:VacB/RNase II family 3'-5' exoribonuclease [Phycisphaerae bacterium]